MGVAVGMFVGVGSAVGVGTPGPVVGVVVPPPGVEVATPPGVDVGPAVPFGVPVPLAVPLGVPVPGGGGGVPPGSVADWLVQMSRFATVCPGLMVKAALAPANGALVELTERASTR